MSNVEAHGASTAENLPVDQIRVAISRRIEADYDERGVFLNLRRPPGMAGSSLASVHWCTPSEVQAILQDASERRAQARGGLQSAYTTFINAVEQSAENAEERRDWLSGDEPLQGYESERYRTVYVIPSQFASIDLPSDLKLPGTPGGPVRSASYKDREGRLCSVTRAFYLSPKAYQVTIHFTKKELRERLAAKEAKRNPPKYKSAEDYREKKAYYFANLATIGLPSKEENCAFGFEPSILEAVRHKVREAECLLRSARIVKLETKEGASLSPVPLPAAAKPNTLRLVHSATGTTT